MNPILEGIKVTPGLDLFAKGFTDAELTDVYYGLSADTEDEALLMETASMEEIDAEYNPGEIEMLLEAVTVRKFSQTTRRMAALTRALNKNFDGITADVAQIGKVKKTGLFASVTVQIPLSDGQVISVVFHSPDGDNRKIMPDDEIIAFRWLLNKRDITQAVSPESGREVTLEQISKRITQIAAKNSEKFQKRSKQVGEQKAALRTANADLEIAKASRDDLMMEITAQTEDAGTLDMDIENAQAQLDAAIARNEDLQNQIDRWKQADAENKAASDATEKAISDLLQNNTVEELEKQHSDIQKHMESPGFEALPESEQEVYRKDEYNLFTAKNQAKANEENAAMEALKNEAFDLGMNSENVSALVDQGVDTLRKVVRDLQLKQKADDEAQEIGRLQRLGTEKVPGVRLGDAEAAGRTWESLQGELISQDEWDKYVEDLYATGRAKLPEPKPTPENIMAGTFLRRIMTGEYDDDLPKMGETLDWIKTELAKTNLTEEYKDRLEQAVAHYENLQEQQSPEPTPEPDPPKKETVEEIVQKKFKSRSTASLKRSLETKKGNIDDETMEFTRRMKEKGKAWKFGEKDKVIVFDEGQEPIDPIGGKAWEAPTENVKSMPETKFQKIYDVLEDENYHAENIILMAKRFGTDADVIEAESLFTEQENAGELTSGLQKKRRILSDNLNAIERERAGLEPIETPDPPAVQSLNSIINGDLDDDPDALDKALDMAADELEEAGLMDQYDELLNEAADHYTVVLEQLKEAA